MKKVFALLFICLPLIAVAQDSLKFQLADNPCGYRMYGGGYQPKPIVALTDMPLAIQDKLKTLLLDRVGASFYKRLILNLGQEIDLEKFKKNIPAEKIPTFNMPPTYSLCLSVLDTLRREEIYSFRINLDSTGVIMDQLNIPDVKHYPDKALILSKTQISSVGLKNGITEPYPRGSFDAKIGSVIWTMEKAGYVGPDGGRTRYTILRVDAHTGKVLSKKKEVRFVQF